MVSPTPRCIECGAELAPGLLVCPGCRRLVHGPALSRLASEAQAAETSGDLTTALATWRRAVALLPPGTVQQETIARRMSDLSAAIDGRAPAPSGAGRGKAKAGGVAAGAGAAGVALLKSKALLAALLANGKLLLLGLMKIPTLLSMLVYMHWMGGRGVGFGLGLIASIYVHEVGHVAALRRYGIEASAPMFVPGFGALVRMKQYPTDAHEEARVGLAGPLWGLFAAAVAAGVAVIAHSAVAWNVASLGATINCFNLIPVWQLDGARGLRALARPERVALAVLALGAALALHQWMPAIVGAVTALRAAGRDAHPTGDRRMFVLFAFLVMAHAIVGSLGPPLQL